MSEYLVCSCIRVQVTCLTRDGPAKSANGHRIFVAIPQTSVLLKSLSLKITMNLHKTLQLAPYSTDTSECEIFSYIIMVSFEHFKINSSVFTE